MDLSAYAQVKTGANISYTEVAPAQCEYDPLPSFVLQQAAGLFKGSIMVKRNAQAYIEGMLSRT